MKYEYVFYGLVFDVFTSRNDFTFSFGLSFVVESKTVVFKHGSH